MLLRNTSLSSSARLKNTQMNFPVPFSYMENDNNDLTEKFTETNFKKNALPVRTKNSEIPYLEYALKTNIVSSKCLKNYPEDFHVNKNGNTSFDMIDSSNRPDLTSLPKDYHRRHHSDPVLSFLDKSNSKIAFQKYALRSHSFLGSSNDSNNKLCNSLTMPFKSKEYEYLQEEMNNLKDINNKVSF